MLLKRLKLKNIRSYTNEEIHFPEGSAILAGDIGAGKSTLLKAIEFALFGIQRGETTGEGLLRNGTNEGNAELEWETNNNIIIIKRTIKRKNNSIEQEAGQLTINGTTETLSPTELKAKIITILGYPQELATKGKNALYRFTVYTTQEEMKRILEEEPETRIELLRKLFQLDKYRIIRDAITIYLRFLKEERKINEALSAGVEEQQKTEIKLKEESTQIEQQLQIINKKLEQQIAKTNDCKRIIEQYEKELQQLTTIKKDAEIINTKIKSLDTLIYKLNARTNELNILISTLHQQTQSTPQINIENANEEIAIQNKHIQATEEQQFNIQQQIANSTTTINAYNQLNNKITNLNTCPLCLQPVTQEHKHEVLKKEEENAINAQKRLVNAQTELQTGKQTIQMKRKQIEELQQKINEMKINKIKQEQLNERKNEKERITIEITDAQKSLFEEKIMLAQLNEQLIKIIPLEQEYTIAKKHYEDAQKEMHQCDLVRAQTEKEQQNIKERTNELEKSIKQKQKNLENAKKIAKTSAWLTDTFTPMTETIEKQVLSRVYNEFNEKFQILFSALIEDEMFNGRLDETFSPIIMQNEHDIPFEALSGGERTACALAYRLALTTVINELISTINTKQLLILDEPTDGFSTQQLERLRTVLQELSIKQLLIVSHEEKLESYADNIIRIVKENGVSKIIG